VNQTSPAKPRPIAGLIVAETSPAFVQFGEVLVAADFLEPLKTPSLMQKIRHRITKPHFISEFHQRDTDITQRNKHSILRPRK
jgi:hypothetical protein